MRTASLILAALLSLLAGSGSVCAAPNIVLFVADDLGADLGCYGNDVIKTPNIDALARQGTRYTHAFCTTASCSPSRSVILTGLHNHANAQYGLEHSYHHFRSMENTRSLPARLTEAGYRTARIGKLHVGPEAAYKFEKALPGNARNTVLLADNCRDFIAEKSDKPFFLYFCPTDPHRGGGPVPGDPLKPDSFGNRPMGYPDVKEVEYSPDSVRVPEFLPDTPTSRAEIAQYYQSVSRVDQGLGRLVQHLQEAGVYDNTVIIFTSDHGIAFPGAKTTQYEGGLRIPLIVRQPKAPTGVSDALVSTVDYTPTILALAGALDDKTAAELHGRSFTSTIGKDHVEGFDEVYGSHTFHEVTMYYPMRTVRTRQYKLIYNIAHQLPFPFASDLFEGATWQEALAKGESSQYGPRTVKAYSERPKFELYDLEADPHEAKNLAESPEHREVLADLTKKLHTFQTRTKDPWLLKWRRE